MVITDRYDHIIDDKNRLAIPAQIRNNMDPQIDGTAFFLVPSGRFLELIPEKLFEQLSKIANAGLEVPPDVAEARRLKFSATARLDPDKAGRVIVPERFLMDGKGSKPGATAILDREVTLVGVGDRMEVWNREAYEAHYQELEAKRATVMAGGGKMFTTPPGTSAATG